MIVFLRHGQTTSNERGLLVGRSDPALTALGERQALALRPLLTRVREVWSSPLARARATAELALPDLVATLQPAFVEVDYGQLEGQPLGAVSLEQWRLLESDHSRPLGDGESLASVDARVHRELEALLADPTSWLHDEHQDLAIVSHVSPIKSAVAWALGVPGAVAWRTRLDNGSLTTVMVRRATPVLVNFNVVPPPG